MGIHIPDWIIRNILVIKLSGFDKKNFTPTGPAPVVSVLEDRHIMQCHHKYDIIYFHVLCHRCKKSVRLQNCIL